MHIIRGFRALEPFVQRPLRRMGIQFGVEKETETDTVREKNSKNNKLKLSEKSKLKLLALGYKLNKKYK